MNDGEERVDEIQKDGKTYAEVVGKVKFWR